MINEVYAVFSHEWRGLFRYRESARSGWIRWIALAILGLIIASSLGPEFGQSWLTIPAVAFMAIISVPAIVADSFAGERERKTLETILASRISTGALLTGKYCAIVLYGLTAASGMVLLGLFLAQLRGDLTGIRWPQPEILAMAMTIALLGAGAVTGLGIVLSLRAATVRRATESLTIALFLIALIPALISELQMPRWIEELLHSPAGSIDDGMGLPGFLTVAGLLLMINAALLGFALTRFRRDRLIS